MYSTILEIIIHLFSSELLIKKFKLYSTGNCRGTNGFTLPCHANLAEYKSKTRERKTPSIDNLIDSKTLPPHLRKVYNDFVEHHAVFKKERKAMDL